MFQTWYCKTDSIEAGKCCKQTDLGFPMVELVAHLQTSPTMTMRNLLTSKFIVLILFFKDFFHFPLQEDGCATCQCFYTQILTRFSAKLYICSNEIFIFLQVLLTLSFFKMAFLLH